jgi:hypothetical protein
MKPHRPLSETMKVGSANIRFPLRCELDSFAPRLPPMCRKQLRIRSRRRGGALEGNREIIGRFAGDFAEATSFDRRRLCTRMELPGARASESLIGSEPLRPRAAPTIC